MDIGSIIGAGAGAAGRLSGATRAISVEQLGRGNSMQTTNASAPQSSAALAAGVLAFAAVGVLVTMRLIFKGAVS